MNYIYVVIAYGVQTPGDMHDTEVPVASYNSEEAAKTAVREAETLDRREAYAEFKEDWLFVRRGFSVERLPFIS